MSSSEFNSPGITLHGGSAYVAGSPSTLRVVRGFGEALSL